MDVATGRDVVKNLSLLQVFNWKVKDTAFETVQLFNDFYAVRCALYGSCPHFCFNETYDVDFDQNLRSSVRVMLPAVQLSFANTIRVNAVL